ncbi:MAG: hypothetical protein V1796_06180 [Pseudomonadota bacterium]
MFAKCPKCNFERKTGEVEAPERCPACGLIFAKYLQAPQGRAVRPPVFHPVIEPGSGAEPAATRPALLAWVLYVPARVDRIGVYGRSS